LPFFVEKLFFYVLKQNLLKRTKNQVKKTYPDFNYLKMISAGNIAMGLLGL